MIVFYTSLSAMVWDTVRNSARRLGRTGTPDFVVPPLGQAKRAVQRDMYQCNHDTNTSLSLNPAKY